MKWYLIKEEYEAKIIGNVRGLQSEEMIAGYNYGGDNSVGKIPSNSYNNSKIFQYRLWQDIIKTCCPLHR